MCLRLESLDYYRVGYGEISTFFSSTVENCNSKEDTISFFLGEIGDTRGLYRTFIGLATHERKSVMGSTSTLISSAQISQNYASQA